MDNSISRHSLQDIAFDKPKYVRHVLEALYTGGSKFKKTDTHILFSLIIGRLHGFQVFFSRTRLILRQESTWWTDVQPVFKKVYLALLKRLHKVVKDRWKFIKMTKWRVWDVQITENMTTKITVVTSNIFVNKSEMLETPSHWEIIRDLKMKWLELTGKESTTIFMQTLICSHLIHTKKYFSISLIRLLNQALLWAS